MPSARKSKPNAYCGMGTPAKHDFDELAKKVLEWSELPDSWELGDFIVNNGLDPSCTHDYCNANANFARAWKLAKIKVGKRRTEMTMAGEMPHYVWSRNIHNYDVLSTSEERHYLEGQDEKNHDRKKDLLKFEYELKAMSASQAPYTQEDLERLNALQEQIKALNHLAYAKSEKAKARKSRRTD